MSRQHVPSVSGLRRLLGMAVLAGISVQGGAAFAQGANRSAQAIPPALQDMRKTWATAVLKSDGKGAAALALLPLQFDGYQAPKTVPRAFYLSQVPHWSTLGKCLLQERMEPVKGRSRLGTHQFNCDGHGFFFAQRDGIWRQTGYENSNE